MDTKSEYKFLSKIHSPADLRRLPEGDMPELCNEIRRCLIDRVTENGGHLASNLGIVELTVAMHRVFDCPYDHFIFDVGHQSYVHKLLTGRYESFEELRRGGGISGFTKRQESEYDCFGAGHSSTSLSAALGFAVSDALSDSDAYTIAVVGDGAFTGGMIHEALNNCDGKLKLIMILNENEMSISKNTGRFANNLARLRRRTSYVRAKRVTTQALRKIPLVGEGIFRFARHIKKTVKNAFFGSVYFEDLGLYYLGPADGNNYADVVSLLKTAKDAGESVVVHLKTKKGKGYSPAEENPGKYHGLSPKGTVSGASETFSDASGRILTDVAFIDMKVCAITAAMSYGTGLETFASAHRDRFFDVGIAEEHAVTFGAGLSANGYYPVFSVYSTFLQRGYDQMIHDVALQKLPMLFCIDRAGLNRRDGATHHGIFDVAFISQIPNMKIYSPVSIHGLDISIRRAIEHGEIAAVRYPSGCENDEIIEAFYPGRLFDDEIRVRTDFGGGCDVLLVTHGRIAAECLAAERLLLERGVRSGTALCEYIRPYDRLSTDVGEIIKMSGARRVIFVEEEIKSGGFGMNLSEHLRRDGIFDKVKYDIVAVDDDFVIQEREESIYTSARVSREDIAAAALLDFE